MKTNIDRRQFLAGSAAGALAGFALAPGRPARAAQFKSTLKKALIGVPTEETPNWQVYNNFRTQLGDRALDSPDATASRLLLDCAPGNRLNASLRVGSAGHVELPATLSISFYRGDPAHGGVLLHTLSIPGPLTPQSFEDVAALLPPVGFPAQIFAVVDDPAVYTECNELKPVPISSMASRNPRSRSRASWRRSCSGESA